MKNCPSCNNQCAPNARTCPKCGHTFTNAGGVFLAIVLGLIVGGLFLASL